jgi:hypothetical protein
MDRDALHEKIMMLKEEIEAKRIVFADGIDIAESLRKVRLAADGKIDPDSVDSRVRAVALGAAVGVHRREDKKISLRESQVEYFSILENIFGFSFAEMQKRELAPPIMANYLASKPELVNEFAVNAEQLFENIRDFWEYYGPSVRAHLEDLQALKSVFGGDIFPSWTTNLATSVGLYIDTLILPDPILRVADLFPTLSPDRRFFFTAKHALNALRYKDLALADLDPPIVVIAPDDAIRTESYGLLLRMVGEKDLLSHAAVLFGRTFWDMAALTAFMNQFASADQLLPCLAHPQRLLFDTDWTDPLGSQIERYQSEYLKDLASEQLPKSVGELVQLSLLGRMMQANDLVFKAARFSGHPLIDAPTSWQYLLWKYQNALPRQTDSQSRMTDALIAKAISVGGSAKIGVIAGLPQQTLIDLRRMGAMEDMRSLIRKGVKEVDAASESSLEEVSEVVAQNLNEAFSKHNRELEDLSSKKKYFGFDVAKWVTFGGMSIAAAATGNTALAVLTAITTMAGTPPSPKELNNRWNEIQSSKERIARSPSGILFRSVSGK